MDRVKLPQKRHHMKRAVHPVLHKIRGRHDDHDLHEKRQVHDIDAKVVQRDLGIDKIRRGQRDKAQHLHHHRADKIIKHVLLPLWAEHGLL